MKYEVTTEFGKVTVEGDRILADEKGLLIIDKGEDPVAIFAAGIWHYFQVVSP